MKKFNTYLEEVVNLRQGIENIEAALRTLYSLEKILDKQNHKIINRKIDAINKYLLEATSSFNIYEYDGIIIEGTLKENIQSAIELLSTILTQYNEGTDDPLSWGKTSKDISATLTEKNREGK